jgi:hypothetical protein
MNSNQTSRTASRKSFLSFGVLSPQNRRQERELPMQENVIQKVPQRTPFKDWKLKRYGA